MADILRSVFGAGRSDDNRWAFIVFLVLILLLLGDG